MRLHFVDAIIDSINRLFVLLTSLGDSLALQTALYHTTSALGGKRRRFCRPRVIESTVRVTLPEGFQRAEFLQTKGAVDFICDRRELRKTIASTLAMLQRQPADAVS